MKIPFNFLALFVLSVSTFMGCQDMNELHESYLENGEIKYTAKVDSLEFLPGNGRTLIKAQISGGFTVDKIVVSWDDGAASKEFPYTKSDDFTDYLELEIDNLKEQGYEMKVVSKDADGNISVPTSIFGSVYGDDYAATLVARSVETFEMDADGMLAISFKTAGELAGNTEVQYTTTAGEMTTATVPVETTTLEVTEVDGTKDVLMRTLYAISPDDEDGNPTSIDEIPSVWVTHLGSKILKDILDSIQITAISGGVSLGWTLVQGVRHIGFDIKVMQGDTEVTSESLTVSESNDAYVIDALDAEPQTVVITLRTEFGASWARAFEITPLQ